MPVLGAGLAPYAVLLVVPLMPLVSSPDAATREHAAAAFASLVALLPIALVRGLPGLPPWLRGRFADACVALQRCASKPMQCARMVTPACTPQSAPASMAALQRAPGARRLTAGSVQGMDLPAGLSGPQAQTWQQNRAFLEQLTDSAKVPPHAATPALCAPSCLLDPIMLVRSRLGTLQGPALA